MAARLCGFVQILRQFIAGLSFFAHGHNERRRGREISHLKVWLACVGHGVDISVIVVVTECLNCSQSEPDTLDIHLMFHPSMILDDSIHWWSRS